MKSMALIDKGLMQQTKMGMCKGVVSAYILQCCLGLLAFFAISWLVGGDNSPLETLIVSVVSGFFALMLSSLWVLKKRGYLVFLIVLLLAYLARILVGLVAYLDIDPGYFSGSGAYLVGHPEIELSYHAASKIFDYLSGNDSSFSILWLGVLNEGESKNPIIHWWMGFFLTSLGSVNSLNLMAFNSFHHCLAGLGITALAIHYGYPHRSAQLAGLLTAWIPWSFPASLLWRDSIGIFFIVFAFALLTIFNFRKPTSYLWLFLSMFLVFAHRTVYPAIVLAVALFEATQHGLRPLSRIGLQRKMAGLLIGLICATGLVLGFGDIFLMYKTDFNIGSLLSRLISLPLLLLRAIFGPFPWLQLDSSILSWERISDYGFHVLQLAAFLVVLAKPRSFAKSINPMTLAFAFFFVFAILAPGIHTSYLAISLPFLLPYAITLANGFHRYVALSLVIFLVANALYFAIGLSGLGLVMEITGY